MFKSLWVIGVILSASLSAPLSIDARIVGPSNRTCADLSHCMSQRPDASLPKVPSVRMAKGPSTGGLTDPA
jgi:hypothetical protein